MTTINVKFDAGNLPAWAKNERAVLERCRNDLSFRANVCSATTAQQRKQLRRDARLLQEQVENRATG